MKNKSYYGGSLNDDYYSLFTDLIKEMMKTTNIEGGRIRSKKATYIAKLIATKRDMDINKITKPSKWLQNKQREKERLEQEERERVLKQQMEEKKQSEKKANKNNRNLDLNKYTMAKLKMAYRIASNRDSVYRTNTIGLSSFSKRETVDYIQNKLKSNIITERQLIQALQDV